MGIICDIFFGETNAKPTMRDLREEAWRGQQLLSVRLDNRLLTNTEREVLRRIGNKLYGEPK